MAQHRKKNNKPKNETKNFAKNKKKVDDDEVVEMKEFIEDSFVEMDVFDENEDSDSAFDSGKTLVDEIDFQFDEFNQAIKKSSKEVRKPGIVSEDFIEVKEIFDPEILQKLAEAEQEQSEEELEEIRQSQIEIFLNKESARINKPRKFGESEEIMLADDLSEFSVENVKELVSQLESEPEPESLKVPSDFELSIKHIDDRVRTGEIEELRSEDLFRETSDKSSHKKEFDKKIITSK